MNPITEIFVKFYKTIVWAVGIASLWAIVELF